MSLPGTIAIGALLEFIRSTSEGDYSSVTLPPAPPSNGAGPLGGSGDAGRLAQAIADLRANTMLAEQFKGEAQRTLQEQGFYDLVVNLSEADLQIGAGGFLLPNNFGNQISFLRRTSTPGALLQIGDGVGIKQPFAPGDMIEGRFKSLTLQLAPGSPAVGQAVLRLALNPQAKFYEFQGDGLGLQPVALLGTLTLGVLGFATLQLEDIIPSGLSPAGSFNISGWKTILVWIDTTSNGGTATSFDLVPYYQQSGATTASALWGEQGTERISVPDTAVSGGQYRVVVIDLSQAQGKLYLAIQNLLAAARTGLSFVVLGVR